MGGDGRPGGEYSLKKGESYLVFLRGLQCFFFGRCFGDVFLLISCAT